ncbi:amidase domain-containing protein [Evansella tamaricis]|uniref:Amidase domain-containing protein n=1 Tax=Evansella tamaricis TaxID=2069301 RepID=A0ABS6JJ77_9BACI|nr:amidase domain-containing protein [Evansella tamaricis]MBU9713698.1 amidase domain-containing protein [Evansella tamaricis]
MYEKVKRHVENSMQCFVTRSNSGGFVRDDEMEAIERKQKSLTTRKAQIVKNIVDGNIIKQHTFQDRSFFDYVVSVQHVIKQKEQLYMEEQLQNRRIVLEDEEIIDDYLVNREGGGTYDPLDIKQLFQGETRSSPDYVYDRVEVVRYAERWWDSFNPEYKQFENDCTNYISQCIFAGGVPMSGQPNRSSGWWYQNNQWSYSWTVAHALRWYLSGSNNGLQAVEVSSPHELMRGDIICYDFNGDDNWQHTTVVTGKDVEGEPLVNAHTTNSRMRFWSYEDSTAWTPNIKYKFFSIIDRNS